MSETPPTDIAILESIGNDLVNLIVCTSTEIVLITIYSMLVIKATSILLRIHKRNSGRMGPAIMLVVVYLMYLINLTCLIIDLVDLVAEVKITLVKDPEVALDIKYTRSRDFTARRLAAVDVLYGYLTCLGDGVIVWRVYAFWASSHIRHLIMAVPVAMLFLSVACSMMLSYCVGRLGPGEIVLGAVLHPQFCRDIQTVSYAIPAATTAIATLLITIKVWNLVRFSGENRIYDSRMSKKSRLEKIVILLIESGVAYFLFFLAQVIQIAPTVRDAINAKPNFRFATNVFIYQTSSIVGLYPTIIICLVHANKSAVNTTLYTVTNVGRESKNHPAHGGRRWAISLGSFRAVVPESSVDASTGGDLESRGGELELKDLQMQAHTSSLDQGDDMLTSQKH
ncbi:hypothetical protein E1B28_004790 [Marasmius oreades]|uniref:Uncharacterized protein n=1 Tax=Marasmius oreades TaxID=181124 RepID=A0A9P7UZJ2_9AGAR|nr:uncharacterized protein E1B28_004790 [Marasmius oreades]KAG7097445.1 hypothetical protein E1B28_004790 [Marasmius oreades]